MRHIKLEIFDDAERCSDAYGRCPHLITAHQGPCRCRVFKRPLRAVFDSEVEALRCPECKAAEVKS